MNRTLKLYLAFNTATAWTAGMFLIYWLANKDITMLHVALVFVVINVVGAMVLLAYQLIRLWVDF